MGNTNRTKGHNAERKYAKLFRELGYPYTQTSRYASRMHDDAGIDLVGLPYNIQVKAGEQRGMKPWRVIKEMKEAIAKLFPNDAREHDHPNIVVHEMPAGRGKKRQDYHTIVSMTYKEFEKIIKIVKYVEDNITRND